jgi:riboflavin synthase
MFTGIVTHQGSIAAIRPLQGGLELDIKAEFAGDCHLDESIAIDGVCQTVVAFNEHTFTVQAVEETLRKTTFAAYSSGMSVNLERSLTLQQGIEGHLVQGHVDCTGRVKNILDEGANWLLTIEYPTEFEPLVVGRGSISVDGISLTVARDEGNTFTLAIIPFTWDHTNLANKEVGDLVNLEFDMLGKYVIKYLKLVGGNIENDAKKGLKKDDLLRMGFGS